MHDGARIRVGNQELVVERRRDESEAGQDGRRDRAAQLGLGGDFGTHPSVRPGYALKRLEASEGPRRWVLRDLEANRFLRMSDEDAELFQLLDGRHSLPELVREAERALWRRPVPRGWRGCCPSSPSAGCWAARRALRRRTRSRAG